MAEQFTVEALNPVTEAIFGNVDMSDKDHSQLVFVPALGFAALNEGESGEADRLRIIGFHADISDRQLIVPALTLAERDPEHRRLDHNAKGLGIISGNTPGSVVRPKQGETKRTIGVYATPVITPDEVISLQHPNPTSARVVAGGLLRHLNLMGIDKLKGLRDKDMGVEAAIKHIERRYGEASLATIDPAPLWLLAQRRAQVQHSIAPVWAIYRDPASRPIERIGTVRP